MESQIDHLKEIFFAGVKRVDPYTMIRERMTLDGSRLRVNDESSEVVVDLGDYEEVLAIGTGKATAKMALAVEELLGDRLAGGVISVKKGHTEPLTRIQTIEAGHPVPDEESLRAAREIGELCRNAGESTLFINLISGGGSACLCSPRRRSDGGGTRSIGLAEKQAVTELLLASGADIGEINTVRKHLSDIKGGGLARMMYPAASLNLILSDVIGDRLDAIASGLTVGDPTTFTDVQSILRRYGIEDRVPDSVRELIEAGLQGKVPETPKPGDALFEPVRNVLLGTNRAALRAAGECARGLGYNVTLLSSQITGEAREIAKFYLGVAIDIAEHDLARAKPACLIAGGETTVAIRGSGKGGRNQEMALSFLRGLAARDLRSSPIYFLSAGTDGNDGPTDAAGAFACGEAVAEAERRGLDLEGFLRDNNSYAFFDAVGFLFKSGPTNTNVCDLQILIVA